MRPDVDQLFDQFNLQYFDGKVAKIPVLLNERLRSSAGLCRWKIKAALDLTNPNPFLRGRVVRTFVPIQIDLHVRLFDDLGWDYRRDGWNHSEAEITLLHEMVHAFLCERGDTGHSPQFQRMMTRITGVHTNHRCHHLNVSKWKPGNKKSSGMMAGAYNPFRL